MPGGAIMIIDNLTGGGKIIWSDDDALFLFRPGENPEEFEKHLREQYDVNLKEAVKWMPKNRLFAIEDWRYNKHKGIKK